MPLPLIEGVGDGVVVLLGILVALVVVIFAWWSTNVSETRVVGVIYLSTSHFNRLLQHLGQTPTTDATAGQSRTFLVPPAEHGNGSVNALSLAQSLPVSNANPARDVSPAAVVLKRGDASSVPAESSAGESVDAGSTSSTGPRPQQGRDVTESGDVYTDAQSSRAHPRSQACSDGGRLRSTPDGVVLEGCMHFDDSGNDMWWTEMYSDDSGEDREDNVAQPIGSRAAAPATNRQQDHVQADNTHSPIRSSSSSNLAHTSSGNVLENHRGKNDNDDRAASAGEVNSVDRLDTIQSSDVRQMARPRQTRTVDAAVPSRCEHTNAASETCNRELCRSGAGVVVAEKFPLSDGNRLSPTIDNRPEGNAVRDSARFNDAGGTIVTANILRARNVQAGYVTVRLKYLDDQQRDVRTRLEDTVADFKRYFLLSSFHRGAHFVPLRSYVCDVISIH